MLIALWIINVILAIAFIASGVMKLVRSKQALVASGMGWADDFGVGTIKLIAVLEILGAVGLVFPMLLNIVPILAPLAAAALAIVMIGATVVHVRRHEPPIPAVVLAVLSIASAVIGFIVLA